MLGSFKRFRLNLFLLSFSGLKIGSLQFEAFSDRLQPRSWPKTLSWNFLSAERRKKMGTFEVGAACATQNIHGVLFLGIIKCDDPWVYHNFWG